MKNFLKNNWFKVGILIAIFIWLLLEIFQVRLNIYYFRKCSDDGGRFSGICPQPRLFVPKR